uniref:Uncharacterized protein n=1 Tax=Solanum tuberosum TaxID=4113 RepID=M1AJA1_SOLTU
MREEKKKRRKEEKKQGITKFLKNCLWISSRGDPYESNLRIWGKNQSKLEVLELKNDQEKLGISRQPERPRSCSKVWALGRRASQRALTSVLKFALWYPVPLRASGTPCLLLLPTSFRTSSLQTYLCFLVDFYTLRYV